MLVEVVFAVKCAFFEGAFLARGVVVRLYVSVVWVLFATEYAAQFASVGVGDSRAVRCANPSLQRQVQRFLVPLPIVLGSESFSTESTLESLEGSSQSSGGLLLGSGPAATSTAAVAVVLDGAERSPGVAGSVGVDGAEGAVAGL